MIPEHGGCQGCDHLAEALRMALTPARQNILAIAIAYALGGSIGGGAFIAWLLGGIFR